MKDGIQITLNYNEAILLFEFLSRFSNDNRLEIVHPSEYRVLWDLQASLKSIVVEPFSEDYGVILEKARKSLQ